MSSLLWGIGIGFTVAIVVNLLILALRELDERRRWYKMFGSWRNRKWRREHSIPLKGG